MTHKNVQTGRCCDYCNEPAVGHYGQHYYCHKYDHNQKAWADRRKDIGLPPLVGTPGPQRPDSGKV